MKRILKYILLLFLVLTVAGISSHDHSLFPIFHEDNSCDFGCIEYICDCGYVYKKCCAHSMKCQEINKKDKEIEEEKNRTKALIFTIKINEVFSKIKSSKEKSLLLFDFSLLKREKVYIVYSKFIGAI